MGHALSARYLVGGSVRRQGDKVRVSVQLTDASNGTQVWAEQYDEQFTDIFQLQDRITRKVAGVIATNLQQIALQQSLKKPTNNLDAYDLLLRARAHANQATRSGNRMARELLGKVIAMQPNYVDAQAELADATLRRAVSGWSEFAEQDAEAAIKLAQKALQGDDESALAHNVLARAYTFQERYDLALAESERALQINPSDADVQAARSEVLLWTGDIKGAIAAGELALRLNANIRPEHALNLGVAYILDKRFADAVKLLENARIRYPDSQMLDFPLAGAYAELGRDAEAADALERGEKKDPLKNFADFGSRFQDLALKRRLDQTMSKAGFK
jgi:adenylate cyclase